MTSQQQQPFNASMAFQNNNGGADGWDDWDWNENSASPASQMQQNTSAPPKNWENTQFSSPSYGNNFQNSYQQSMPYQQTSPQAPNYYQQQQNYAPQQQFQQFAAPPPSDPNQNFNWNMQQGNNFRLSPTTSTEVQHGQSRSTSNCSSEQPQESRIPDARNNTPQMTQATPPPPAMMKQNPQMARLMKTDAALSPQWSVESQISQTSSERSNESGEMDSRSSATVTSDEGGFYHQVNSQVLQPIYEPPKVDNVQETRNPGSEMDKLDQALYEMNVFQGGNQQFASPVTTQAQIPHENHQQKEASLPPPPPMTGNQPNFNQVVKLPSHTPSPPPAFNPNVASGSVSEPPKKATPPLANLPPPPMSADKRGLNPYKRTGHVTHHNVGFQQPTNKLPAVMPTNFYQPEQVTPPAPIVTPPNHQEPETAENLRPVEGFENQESPFTQPPVDVTHARGRGTHVNQQATPRNVQQTPPTDDFSNYGRNQVQYQTPTTPEVRQMPEIRPERGHNQAVGQEIFEDQRRRTDSDRSQSSPHVPAQVQAPPMPVQEPEQHNVSRNDRNEYLQTGHLSEDNYNSRGPPPGMSRYVLGEPENDTLNNQEPPPGLDRMIPGTDLENSQLDMAREADGQVSDSSTVPPSRQFSTPRSVAARNEVEITDRNLYTVPGESGGRPATRRVVPGTEDNRSPTAPSVVQVQQNPVSPPEIQIPEQERELAVDGENLEDQEQQNLVQQPPVRRNEMTREDPIEGADTLDEAASTLPRDTSKAETESNVTGTETGRKETSTNEDSDRGVYYRSKKGASKEDERRAKPPPARNSSKKDKDDYYSDSDYSESERHRYREGSVREGSVNKGERGTLGRRKDDKDRDRDRRDRKYRDDRHERRGYDEDSRRHGRRRDENRDYYDRDEYKNSLSRRRREKNRGDDDDEYAKSDREHRDRRRRDKYEDEEYLKSDRERKRKDRDAEKEDRRRKDDRYDRDRRERRRTGDRRYDEDYEQQRRTGTKSGRSNREDPRYAANYYQQPGYDYNTLAYYQQHQQYFEHLRRTNPQAYAEWYQRLFYAQSQAPSTAAVTTDGRESVHSGRSSVNDNRYNRPIQQFYDPNYHRQQMNQSQNSLALMDQSITSVDYNQAPIIPTATGWNSVGPASLQDHSFYNDNSSYYQSRGDAVAAGVDNSIIEEQLPQRMTPSKYTTSHSTASLSHGLLVSVKPRYSVNGFNDVVKIFSLSINDSTRRLFAVYPGPLQRSSTHKKSVIEFCEEQIRLGPFSSVAVKSRGNSMSSISSANQQNRASYTLLWNYLILLLRQNGSCIGTDISELLMRNQKDFPFETKTSNNGSGRDSALSNIKESRENSPVHENEPQNDAENEDEGHRSFDEEQVEEKKSLTEEEVTEKFRNYLIYGNLDEALEWATENNLWGHALFLASKVNRRQHANVMMKFANKLPLNDPLQTLYQLMSGRTPYSVSCFADEKWGDWRPHLAMIMSNEQERAELNRKSITVLGDSLYNRGDYFGAQFCYLLAEVPFGKYPDVNQESNLIANSPNAVRLVLLGTSQHKNFKEFAINEAIIMTEIYEYARSLYIEEFCIVELQMYKFLLATRILDYGMQLKCLLYMEQISKTILKYPSKFEPKFIERVYVLADRLKYYDPVMEKALDENYGTENVEDQKWLQDLRDVLNQYNLGALTYDQQSRDISFMSKTPLPPQIQASPQTETAPTGSQLDKEFNEINQQFSQLNLQYQQPTTTVTEQQPQVPFYPTGGETTSQEPVPVPTFNTGAVQEQATQENYSQEYSSGNDQYSYNQQSAPQDQVDQSNYYSGQYGYDQNQGLGYEQQQQSSYDYYGQQSLNANEETPRPSITMPGTNSNKSAYYDDDNSGSASLGGAQEQKAAQEQSKKAPAKDAGKQQGNANQGSGWFGGIFNKLSLKPKNQMKLPDDKNPSIVWDPDKKRWVNTEGGEEEQESFKPPPKMADLMPKQQQPMQVPSQPTPTVPMMDQNAVPTMPNGPMTQQPQSEQPKPQSSEPAPTPRLQSNMYKMQRNRTLKKSYVDVFNPSGAPMSKPAEQIMAPAMPSAATPQTGFFVPGGQQATEPQANGAPQFYDPNQYNSYQQ
ncbi:uncharacterized protein LOC134828128 isoform X2 [Culicoides brevitarsis]|uniref:uncharacterized protein LOC134828128 isoform X2 n=1 Tax=Culicoides brevitarsis TaxID=469753 RepID=UPI00307B4583